MPQALLYSAANKSRRPSGLKETERLEQPGGGVLETPVTAPRLGESPARILIRYGTKRCRTNLLRVFCQYPLRIARLWFFPILKAQSHFGIRNLKVDYLLFSVDFDRIAILDESYRPTDKSLRSHMANNESMTPPRKSSVCDQGDILSKTFSHDCRSRAKHFAHPRPSFRTLIANDDNVPFLYLVVQDRTERFFF